MKGIKIPVGASKSGGAATITGDENDKQIISVALGSTDNENAFQQEISLGESNSNYIGFNTGNTDLNS